MKKQGELCDNLPLDLPKFRGSSNPLPEMRAEVPREDPFPDQPQGARDKGLRVGDVRAELASDRKRRRVMPPCEATLTSCRQRSCHISSNNRILRKGKAAVRAYPHHFFPTIRVTLGVPRTEVGFCMIDYLLSLPPSPRNYQTISECLSVHDSSFTFILHDCEARIAKKRIIIKRYRVAVIGPITSAKRMMHRIGQR